MPSKPTNINIKQRRTFLNLCIFYKSYMGIFTSTYSLMHRPSLNLRSHHHLMFTPVHAHTNAYKYSFFTHCINLWNHLPPNIFDGDHTTTITSFRDALLYTMDTPLY